MRIRSLVRSAYPKNAPGVARRLALAATLPALMLSGCYVVPVGPDGAPIYAVGVPAVTPHGAPVPPTPMPMTLTVRAYPANDLAAQTGVLTGSVTNMMSGKGRFQFDFRGEILTGEATRVSGDERRGIASAFGSRGTSVRCEYQMNTPSQGAGSCTLSTGAQYTIHIGS